MSKGTLFVIWIDLKETDEHTGIPKDMARERISAIRIKYPNMWISAYWLPEGVQDTSANRVSFDASWEDDDFGDWVDE